MCVDVLGDVHSNEMGKAARVKLTEDGQQDVDEEISTAATLEEDSKRRKDDGKDDLANVAVQGTSS